MSHVVESITGTGSTCGWRRDIFLPEAPLLWVSAAARTDRALSTSVRLDGPAAVRPGSPAVGPQLPRPSIPVLE